MRIEQSDNLPVWHTYHQVLPISSSQTEISLHGSLQSLKAAIKLIIFCQNSKVKWIFHQQYSEFIGPGLFV